MELSLCWSQYLIADLQIVGVGGVVEEFELEESYPQLSVNSTRSKGFDALAIYVFVLVEDDHPLRDVDLFAGNVGRMVGCLILNFLDASSHLYKRVCLSVRQLIIMQNRRKSLKIAKKHFCCI